MKKLAIGCGIVALVVVVIVVAGGMMLWNRYVKPMAGAVTQLTQVADLEKQVRNTASFLAPDNGELTPDLVARFVKVQEAMEARLGPRMAELKAKYEQVDRVMKSERRQASFGEAMLALKDLSAMLVEAKRAQVDALNGQGFSVKEYEWAREQAYAAIGVVAAGFDVKDIQELARGAGSRPSAPPEPAEVGTVPDRNKELVAPYKAKLQEWAPLAYFGL